jgi:hypothetical protein
MRWLHVLGVLVCASKQVGLGLWEAMPVIGKSEDKAARCLKAAMQWCLFWCVELLAGNRILVNVLK